MNYVKTFTACAVLATTAAALASAPGSTELTCDVDRNQFRMLTQGQTQVVVQLWSAAVGGVQCGANAVPMSGVEAVRTKREPVPGSPARTFLRVTLVIGDDAVAATLCPDARTWVDLNIGGTTIGCDLGARRRLQSVPYARQSDQGFLMPPGSTLAFAGASAPTGWLLCDGAPVSRTAYGALFAVLGTTYGAGDGVSTFNLPDLRGRAPIGMGGNSLVDALGDSDGLGVTARTPAPLVTVPGQTLTQAAHAHGFDGNQYTSVEFGVGTPDPSRRYPKNDFDPFGHRHSLAGAVTTAVAPAISPVLPVQASAQPRSYLTMTYIIKF